MSCGEAHPNPEIDVYCEAEDGSPNTESFIYEHNESGAQSAAIPGPMVHVHSGSERDENGTVIGVHRWESVG